MQVWKSQEFYHFHRRDDEKASSKVIDFTTNDYLSLSGDARILKAAQKAIDDWGLGTAGPSIFAGNSALHDELAKAIAELKHMEACLLCPSGFTANSGVLTGIIQRPGTLVFLDEKDHASIYHGAWASKARLKMFRHNDVDDLKRKLSMYEYVAPKVVFVDGLYSMDGDLAPLPEIHRLARLHNASLWLDDAHSFGVYGEEGSGIESHFGLRGQVDIVTGSLGKTLGAFGGYVCASHSAIQYLEHLGREFVYTTTLPATICAGALEGVRIIREEADDRRACLWKNIRQLKEGLRSAGFEIGQPESPVIPVILKHETLAHRFGLELYNRGIFVNTVTRPAVKRNEARLRFSVRNDHTAAQLDCTLETMKEIASNLKLPLNA